MIIKNNRYFSVVGHPEKAKLAEWKCEMSGKRPIKFIDNTHKCY